MEDYTFKKSTCERYDIRWERFGWAIFTIDENGGVFNCQSDFGSYSYSWPCHGRKSFKHFILELARDSSYFLGKVSRETYFDFESNLKEWKHTIIKWRKDREFSKEEARNAWDFLVDMDSSNSADHVQHVLYDSEAIMALCEEPWNLFCTDKDYPPDAVHFAKVVMPMFADILRKEIESEKKEKASAPTEAVNVISHLDCTIDVSKVEPLADRVWAEGLLENSRNEE